MYYDNLIYESGPVKFTDYISNKYNNVHLELYNDALHSYLYDLIYKLLIEKVLYSLIAKFNNFLTEYNDLNAFIDEETLNKVKEIIDIDNGEFKVLSSANIKNIYSNSDNSYINRFISDIWGDDNCKDILEAFKELDMNEDDQNEYVTSILFNLIILLYTCKKNITNITGVEKISDFIIRYNNSIYITNENNEFILIEENSNVPETILIYEDMIKEDYHIEFTKSGKWILDVDPSIDINSFLDELKLNMNKTNYSIIEIMTNEMIERFLNKHKIIEIKNNEYYKPSSIIIYSSNYPFTKNKVDLTKWWNTYQNYENYDLSKIKILDEKINDNIIEDINYIKGEVNVYSKINDLHYKADFNYVNEDTEINDDKLKDAFYNEIKKLYL